MDEVNDFMDNLAGGIVNGINACMLGKIESIDLESMKADILPMARVQAKDGSVEDMALLIEVPVSFIKSGPFYIRPPYKAGDIVVVVFADSDTENILLSGEVSNPNSERKHSLDDAIVIGSIMPFTEKTTSEHLGDLVITNDDLSTKLVLKEDGEIIIKASKVLLGDDEASEGVPLGNALKSWLDGHTHSYTWSSEGGSGNTGGPNGASPGPSEVTKTI